MFKGKIDLFFAVVFSEQVFKLWNADNAVHLEQYVSCLSNDVESKQLSGMFMGTMFCKTEWIGCLIVLLA